MKHVFIAVHISSTSWFPAALLWVSPQPCSHCPEPCQPSREALCSAPVQPHTPHNRFPTLDQYSIFFFLNVFISVLFLKFLLHLFSLRSQAIWLVVSWLRLPSADARCGSVRSLRSVLQMSHCVQVAAFYYGPLAVFAHWSINVSGLQLTKF